MESVTNAQPATGVKTGIRWLYLAAGTLLLLLLGLIYAWSVFISPLEAEFGWNRAQTSLTFTLSIITFCAGGIAGGFLTRRLAPGLVVGASAALLLAGFSLASRVASLGGIYLAYGVLVGLGVGLSYNVLISTVGRWFPDKKGLCSGVLLMGFGTGSLLLGALATRLMAGMGWRSVFLLIAVVFAALVLAGALVIRPPSAAQAAALPAPPARPGAAKAQDLTPGRMLRRPAFWLYFGWSLFLIAAGLIIIGHAAAAAADLGLTPESAALIAGLVSVANGGGRILFGLLYDRLGLRRTMLGITLCALAAPALLLLAFQTGAPALLGAGFVLTGAFYGGVPTMNSTFAAGWYGQKNFATNFSLVNSTLLFAPLIGSYLAGALRTATGSYASSFLVMLAFAAAAALAGLFVKKP